MYFTVFSILAMYRQTHVTIELKIEQFWPFEEISIFSNGGHLGYRTALTDTILKGGRPVSKMAAITKNRNFFKWPKLLYFKPESANRIKNLIC
jgi:hypothetical protein